MKATGSAVGWLQGLLLAAAMAAPLLSTYALMSGRALPSFLEVLGPPKGRTPLFMTNMLGITLIVTTLIASANRAQPRCSTRAGAISRSPP